jgi:hypothetical protein
VTQVSTGGGQKPLWSHDGRELFYQSGSSLMAVPFRADGLVPVVGAPRPLFEGRYAWGADYGRSFDLHPDGERFLMVQLGDRPLPPTQYRLVVNWFEELKRLVPSS